MNTSIELVGLPSGNVAGHYTNNATGEVATFVATSYEEACKMRKDLDRKYRRTLADDEQEAHTEQGI